MNNEPNNVVNNQITTEWDSLTKVKKEKGEYYKSVDIIEESYNAQSEGSEWVKMTPSEIKKYRSSKKQMGHNILKLLRK